MHVREQGSVTAVLEKRLLVWIARRLPRWVTSDGLTALGLAAMACASAGFAALRFSSSAAYVVVAALAVNWFGDSLDGTVARVRHLSVLATATTSITSSTSQARRCCSQGSRHRGACTRSSRSARSSRTCSCRPSRTSRRTRSAFYRSSASDRPNCASCSPSAPLSCLTIRGFRAGRCGRARVRRRRAVAIVGLAVAFMTRAVQHARARGQGMRTRTHGARHEPRVPSSSSALGFASRCPFATGLPAGRIRHSCR